MLIVIICCWLLLSSYAWFVTLSTNNHFDKVLQEVAGNCAFLPLKKDSDRMFIGPLFPVFQ